MKSFAKFMCVLAVAVGFSTAYSAYPEDPSLVGDPNILGEWKMVSRNCSSGLPPRDNFIPGRDVVEISFRGNTFRTFSDVAGCVINSSGYYEQSGPYLSLDIVRQSSTCFREPFWGRITYRYATYGHRMRIDVGPVDGGVCPYGDILSVHYTRL